MPTPAPPTSTYRLHLTGEFTLTDARDLVDHVAALGAAWMYASPVQTVPVGATHGYHILDPDRVSPELGGREALEGLAADLRAAGMGLLLDIVPNHLAAGPENAWWDDLLRHGPESVHARTFDVDATATGPIVLPVLDAPLDEIIAEGRLALRTDGDDPRLVLDGGLSLPVAPGTDLDGDLADVVAGQHYRLLPWQEGERTLNWRRFFAINDLAGVRVEDPEVFDAMHRLVLDLLRSGVVQGLRVDHVDGLADPGAYLQRLRDAVGPDTYLLVEKIIELDEELPAWPIAGTTGYEVATLLTAWLLDREGHQQLRTAFTARTGIDASAVSSLPGAKREALAELFTGELATVQRLLGPVTGVPDDQVASILRDLTAHLPGYRTYVPLEGHASDADLAAIAQATQAAEVTHRRSATAVADALLSPGGRPALWRWQQLTGPAAAKGFEDRLLFRAVPLASLCEVGMDAHTLDAPPDPDSVVAALAARQAAWPHAGSTTSTHDTKRAEDVRARISVLAEMPDAFVVLLDDLAAALPDTPIDPHAGWLLTEDLLGALGWVSTDPADLAGRLHTHAEKALREAGLGTAHRDIDAVFEGRVHDWIDAVTSDPVARDHLEAMRAEMDVPAASNALATVLLKIAGPGVPDIYRGTEVWDDSLVDPDNRRPLEVTRILRVAAAIDALMAGHEVHEVAASLRGTWRDGGLKLHVTRSCLRERARLPELYLDGGVAGVDVDGPARAHVCALARHLPAAAGDIGGPDALAIATRLPHRLAGSAWPIGEVWGGTSVAVGDRPLTDVLTGREHQPEAGRLALDRVLDVLPLAMLVVR